MLLWPWPDEEFFIFGRATDVSLHGMRVTVPKYLPAAMVSPGEVYRIDVNPWPWPHADARCVAVIRHLNGDSIGVETKDGLPVERL